MIFNKMCSRIYIYIFVCYITCLSVDNIKILQYKLYLYLYWFDISKGYCD